MSLSTKGQTRPAPSVELQIPFPQPRRGSTEPSAAEAASTCVCSNANSLSKPPSLSVHENCCFGRSKSKCLDSVFFWQRCCGFKKPTRDQLRWPLQAGASAGLAALLLTFLPASRSFFSAAGIIGPVVAVIGLEATAGGSLRRAWWIAIFSTVGALLGYALFALSTLATRLLGSEVTPYLILFCAVFIVLPAAFLRFRYPSAIVGVHMGLSTAEVVLLSAFGGKTASEPWDYALKRVCTSIIGSLCSVLASQFIIPQAARPTAANSLATILICLGEILEPLASLGNTPDNDVARVTSSSALLFSSYPQLVGRPWRMFSETPIMLDSATQEPRQQDKLSFSQTSFWKRFEPEKQQCETMVRKINQCQSLLSAQQGLIDSAAQEVSCHKPWKFPRRQYEAIVGEIRTLFFHIASLVFAVNLSITTLESASSGCNTFSHTTQAKYRRLPLKERFRWRTLIRSAYRRPTTPLQSSPVTPPHKTMSQPDHVCSYNSPKCQELPNGSCLGTKTPHSKYLAPPSEYLVGESPVSRFPAAGATKDDAWAQIEGALLGRIAGHMSEALKQMANCLRERQKTTDAALREIRNAANGIRELEDKRKIQRQKFAEILLTTLEADVTGEWATSKDSGVPTKRPELDWVNAIGISAETYRSLHASEKLEYWEAYWLGRDRISNCSITLNTIKDSLFRCSRLLDDYVGVALHATDPVFPLLP